MAVLSKVKKRFLRAIALGALVNAGLFFVPASFAQEDAATEPASEDSTGEQVQTQAQIENNDSMAAPASIRVLPPLETQEYAAIRIVDGVVQFSFAPDKVFLPDGARAALASAVLAAKNGQFIVISSYRSPEADVQAAEDIARQRGTAIRTVLIAMGAPEQKIIVLKPQEVAELVAGDAQLRRLDVVARRQASYDADAVFVITSE